MYYFRCLKQNNTIDIYDNYFDGDLVDVEVEPPSAKGLAVFRDPHPVKRYFINSIIILVYIYVYI